MPSGSDVEYNLDLAAFFRLTDVQVVVGHRFDSPAQGSQWGRGHPGIQMEPVHWSGGLHLDLEMLEDQAFMLGGIDQLGEEGDQQTLGVRSLEGERSRLAPTFSRLRPAKYVQTPCSFGEQPGQIWRPDVQAPIGGVRQLLEARLSR
jgi:hypothetical protein